MYSLKGNIVNVRVSFETKTHVCELEMKSVPLQGVVLCLGQSGREGSKRMGSCGAGNCVLCLRKV